MSVQVGDRVKHRHAYSFGTVVELADAFLGEEAVRVHWDNGVVGLITVGFLKVVRPSLRLALRPSAARLAC